MRIYFTNWLLGWGLALLAFPVAGLFAQGSSTVTLSPTAAPSAAEPGVTVINVTGSGFPTGTITPNLVTVTLAPATSGPKQTAIVSAVTTVVGSTRRVTFQVAAGIPVSSPTNYLVSLSGSTSSGATFSSGNTASLTINPPATITINPTSGQPGPNIPVAITGGFTNFVQGSSMANFGAGIMVMSLAVSSPTAAVATINISPSATPGPRTVTVTTGSEIATLPNGFTVGGTPMITLVSPNTGQQGQANLAVTISAQLTHFAQPTTQVSLGADIKVNSVMVNTATNLTANITIPSTANKGGHTVTVTTGSEVVPLANGFTVQPGPPMVTLTSPANLSFLNLSPTTVNGTVSDPTATVTVNSIPAPVSNGAFSIALPLAEGPNIITATATSSSGLIGTASITVTLDTTRPHVTITSPPDQFVTTDSSISVAGSINDIVVGTVNPQQATVTVNGVPAQVANRTFLAVNIPLTIGNNPIQAVGRDRAGNAGTTQITVVRQTPPQAPQIKLISGNNQTGMIGSVLAAPLVVALTNSTGGPVPSTLVIFKVTQNNGMVANGGTPAASVVAMTNAQGQAQAQWTLGMRAGAGGNTLEAYAVGFSGTAIFTATGNQGAAGNIVIDSGNNQIGAVNQPLPLPLIAVVVDAGSNRLANVPVTFTVLQGGGNFNGQSTITASTDSDGRVAATLTLGLQEGNSNNLIQANFPGNQGFAASFTASGRAEGSAANTVITGVVLDNSNVPIPGVTIRALLTNVLNSNSSSVNSAATALTNAQGQFSISQAPVGFVKLMVDGSTAQRTGTYPTLDYDMVTIAGQNNTLEKPVYLLPLNPANQLCVTATTGGGTLTIPEAPGFSLTFGPGQVTFPGGSQEGCVSVTVVHPDKVPMTPGFGQQPRFIVTIQPTGAIFNPPAPITLPNVDGLSPRAVTEMYSFDHDIGSFVAIGTGTVSDDGQVIRSNQGVGVLKAGWHCGGNPNLNGTAATCPACNTCNGNTCVPDPLQTTCTSACIQGGVGLCQGGACTGGTLVNCGPATACANTPTCDPILGCQPGTPINCNSGNPCLNDGCDLSSGCTHTDNQLCQNACNGMTSGSCTVTNGTLTINGTCDSTGSCNICTALGAGANCTCGGGSTGTCDSGGQCQGCRCQATIAGLIPRQQQPPDGSTCWATATAVLLGFSNPNLTTELQVVNQADQVNPATTTYLSKYTANMGLNRSQYMDYLMRLGIMNIYSGPTPTPCKVAQILKVGGPVLMTTGEFIIGGSATVHAEVLVGIDGDGTPQGTTVSLVDPAIGSIRQTGFVSFINSVTSTSAAWPQWFR